MTEDNLRHMDRLLYAGIGPRNCPLDVCETMVHTARELNKLNWIVRSGHAQGADQAWATGHHPSRREIFLPWSGFNQGQGPNVWISPSSRSLEAVAKLAHPNWANLTQGGRKLMMRNVSIILGPQLDDPVKFVAYWAPDRVVQGGTGNAVRLAQMNDIPAFNIRFDDDQQAMTDLVNRYG